jgi:hypothetical protein
MDAALRGKLGWRLTFQTWSHYAASLCKTPIGQNWARQIVAGSLKKLWIGIQS